MVWASTMRVMPTWARLALLVAGHLTIAYNAEHDRLLLACGGVALADARTGEILDGGGRAEAYPVDLTDAPTVDAMMESILSQHGKIDILINNAGRSIRRSAALSVERLHDYERCMQINYFAPLRLIHHLLPSMLEAGDGHIINVLTWGTLMPAAYFTAYTASKAALGTAAQGMDAELRSKGVAFTGLHYPLVHTAMSAPTRHYRTMPGMSVEKAGSWMVKAVRDRPSRIAPSYAVAAGLGTTLLPRISAGIAGRLKF